MIYPVVRLKFDRKHRASESKPGKVDVEIYFEGKRKYFSTGVSVLPSEWSGGCVVGRLDAFVLNKAIEKLKNKINETISVIMTSGEPFSFGTLDMRLCRMKTNGSFLVYLRGKIDERTDVRESTKKAHRKLLSSLKEFGKVSMFSDLSAPVIREYDRWLHGKYENNNTVFTYHKNLKSYLNIAVEDGMLEMNPYSKVKIKKGIHTPQRRFLHEDELRAIEELNVDDEAVMNARDLFLLQCYTGMAYSDLSIVDFKSLERRGDRYILHRRRYKTGVEFHVVLLSPAVEILKRHDFNLPVISLQKFNQALKAVAAHAGLRFNLTSHCGRHTYATWALNKGVPVETLKTMLGHSNTKTTEIYAKMLNQTVEDAFEMLEDKIQKEKG